MSKYNFHGGMVSKDVGVNHINCLIFVYYFLPNHENHYPMENTLHTVAYLPTSHSINGSCTISGSNPLRMTSYQNSPSLDPLNTTLKWREYTYMYVALCICTHVKIYLPLNLPTDKGENVMSHEDFSRGSKHTSSGPDMYAPSTVTYNS